MTPPHSDKAATVKTTRLMRIGVFLSMLLALSAGALFYWASERIRRLPVANAKFYKVKVGTHTCEPSTITVPAGKTTFEITNASERVLEWEILDGVMVIEERENIAPGLRRRLTANLAPGDYAMTCGLLSSPRGRLHVTPSEQSVAAAARPPLRAFIGPLSEYKVYLIIQSGALKDAADALAVAIKAGDLQGARKHFAEAREAYKTIEAVAGRYADLHNAIDPTADYLEKREADPAFTGFHRIEFGLWHQASTEGLEPVASKLADDVAALKSRLGSLKLTPEELAAGAARLAEHVASRIPRGEDRYAKTDLADLEASLAGLGKIASLLRPLVSAASPDVAAALDTRLAAARTLIAAHKSADGFVAYDTIDAKERQKIEAAFQALAKAFLRINPAIGLG